jgi:PAS domain S-box-containing protein
MNASYASELETSMQGYEDVLPATTGVGILVADSMSQRLIESAALQINLNTIILHPDALNTDALADLDLIVLDLAFASRMRDLLAQRRGKGDGIDPGIIAVTPTHTNGAATPSDSEQPDLSYDAHLTLPQSPSNLAAQLSLVLYSHRAFARRYRNALEELHLNRRIFRSVTSGISVADARQPDIPLTYVNPAFEAMTGYALEEVIGKNCRFLQSSERDQPALTVLREAIAARREVTVILKNFRKDGTPFWNELSLSPIRNREGVVTHFVGIQTDVTARVEFESALRESEKLAAVGRLASSIAHEINNPLESVMNLIYIAERTDCPPETKHYLATADRELQRVKLITTQSLRFFKQSTKPQAVGCTVLLESVLDLYQSRLQNAHISIERRERSTQSIVCMESEIRQVLNNLVSNAIDAISTSIPGYDAAAQPGCLRIRTREATEWRSRQQGVLITIADNGVGISTETLANIYTAFYTTKGIGGTGLGLWISAEIVERHHGRLMVRSSQSPRHHGTVFQLFLPYQSFDSVS